MPKCHHVAKLAQNSLTAAATPIGEALIQALPSRYPYDQMPDDFTVANKAYANATREVYREFGLDDLNLATLFADVLMNWMPREVFEARTGKPITNSPVFEIRDVLKRGCDTRKQRNTRVSCICIFVSWEYQLFGCRYVAPRSEASNRPRTRSPHCRFLTVGSMAPGGTLRTERVTTALARW